MAASDTSDQESHSIASLLSSCYTLSPFSSLEAQLKQAEREANGDMSTDILLERAQKRLAVYEQDKDRTRPHFSNLRVSKQSIHLDPYKLLKVILERAPSEYGRRYVAAAIYSCGDTKSLVEFSNIWLRYLLIPLAGNLGNADILPGGNSESSTTTSDDEEEYVHDSCWSDSDTYSAMVKLVRLRDGYQCPITEIYRTGAAPPGKKRIPLAVHYILKCAIGMFDPMKDKGSLATWEILRRYAGWDEKRTQEVIENLDTPLNGILVIYPYDYTWDRFVWSLKPALNFDGTVIPNTYDIEVIIQDDFPTVWAPIVVGSRSPINRRIGFKDRGSDPAVQEYMPEEDIGFLKQPRLMPDPELIALHRALAWVFYTSGAGEAIESVFKDLRAKLPSDKIRNADKLDEMLSNANGWIYAIRDLKTESE